MLRAIESPFRGTVSESVVGDSANDKSDDGTCCDRSEDGVAPVIVPHPVIATRRIIQAVMVIVAQIHGPAMRRIVSADIVARAVTITIVVAILDRAAGMGVVHARRRIIARRRTMHDHRAATIVIVVPPIAIVRPVTAIIASVLSAIIGPAMLPAIIASVLPAIIGSAMLAMLDTSVFVTAVSITASALIRACNRRNQQGHCSCCSHKSGKVLEQGHRRLCLRLSGHKHVPSHQTVGFLA